MEVHLESRTKYLSEREKGYRQHYLQADIKLSTPVILIWLIAVAVFIPVDYHTLGFTKEFYAFLTARLFFTACILAVIFGFRRITEPRQYDILICFVLLLGIVFDILGCIMLEQDYIGQLILDILIIITIYAIFPAPVSAKVIASLLLSTKTICLLINHAQILGSSGASIVTGVLTTNVLGYYSWNAIANFRYQQYAIHMELEQARKKAEYLARIDPLTDINNRRAFTEQGQEEFSRSRRYQRLLSLVMIDIDNLKPINDQYGHQAGDLILKLFSQTVNRQIREQDILGRIGGDEFGLLLPETTLQEAQVIATRLGGLFRQNGISLQNQKIATSFSAGVATIQPSDESFEQLLHRADQKLYLAKNTGKRRVEI